MIFVTLGTQDKNFKRLLLEIEKLICENYIKDKVVVQAGTTQFSSSNMELFDFVDMDKINYFISSCDLLITHGGVGSILSGLNHNKTVIAVARLEKYGEHENDHQLQIIKEFSDKGYIIGCQDVSELKEALKQSKIFKGKPYQSNNESFCSLIKELIEKG